MVGRLPTLIQTKRFLRANFAKQYTAIKRKLAQKTKVAFHLPDAQNQEDMRQKLEEDANSHVERNSSTICM